MKSSKHWVWCLPFLIGLPGCAYSSSRPFSDDIQTVHVKMLHSKEFRRELEFRLTEAISKRIEMDTPYRIVAQRKADALLTGEILQVDNRTFGDETDTGRPREIGSTLVVRYRLEDLRSGKMIVEHPRFIYQTSYVPPVGETLSDAMTRALDGVAERIVESMEVAW
ncbi:MAG: LPS assembly lipoprotein LptE [Phycisphaerae bacterium]